ncbi:MAG: complex I NDUFA9 subunit family protein [Candidatus Zixiibacteriota bacterium]|nr:MAG: complex I NDUFA9 subunit family protein [candidate division Zixibacteria bacterium]
MRIAVTGGTGFIGRHLVRRLARDHHEITLMAHRRPAGDLPGSNIRVLPGRLDDVSSLEKTFAAAEAVFHLVGIIAETRQKTFQKTVVEGTENVVRACRTAGVKKIIYLSAMGTAPTAPTEYHRTKYRAEQAVISSGLDYVIYRPSVVYGEGDGFVSLLTRLIKLSPVTPVIGHGRYRFQPVYIDDLVAVMAGGLTCRDARNNIIEVGGPEQLEYIELLNLVKSTLGKSRVNLHLPIGVMKIVARILESLLKPAPITRDQLTMMEMGNTGDISKMKKLFGLEPLKMKEGLEKYLR